MAEASKKVVPLTPTQVGKMFGWFYPLIAKETKAYRVFLLADLALVGDPTVEQIEAIANAVNNKCQGDWRTDEALDLIETLQDRAAILRAIAEESPIDQALALKYIVKETEKDELAG